MSKDLEKVDSQNIDKPKESESSRRPVRKPIHKRRMLEAKQRPGFVRRWVNEDIGAVDAFLDAGWALVKGDEDASDKRVQNASQIDSVVRRVVNRDPTASAKTAVLMEIPEDLYQEDQLAKQREVDKREASYDPNKFSVGGVEYGTFKKHNN